MWRIDWVYDWEEWEDSARMDVYIFQHDGEFPHIQQKIYQWEGMLWHNQELNEAASDYVRANAVVTGFANMISISSGHWINQQYSWPRLS